MHHFGTYSQDYDCHAIVYNIIVNGKELYEGILQIVSVLHKQNVFDLLIE